MGHCLTLALLTEGLVPAMGTCHSLGTTGPPTAAATAQGLTCTVNPSPINCWK